MSHKSNNTKLVNKTTIKKKENNNNKNQREKTTNEKKNKNENEKNVEKKELRELLKPLFELVENEKEETNGEKYLKGLESLMKQLKMERNQSKHEEFLVFLLVISLFEFPNESKRKQLEKKLGGEEKIQLLLPSSTSKKWRESCNSILHRYASFLNSIKSQEKKEEENNNNSQLKEGVRLDGKSWLSYSINLMLKLEKYGLQLIEPFSKSEKTSLNNYLESASTLNGSEITEGIARLNYALIFVAYLNDTRFISNREEVFTILEDLKQCCKGLNMGESKSKQNKKSEEEEEESPILVFVDLLVDIISRQSDLLHRVAHSGV
eukprot:TRINITY_DN1086_c0_g1_i1.p1 TRINITY_DN1086_c0_g1~~TRINITY_DN1086_c0_g1_i1.p1  ORF type:complete len:321 (-),score=124.33 TRINITY_DN1086_c0_g1_i1:1454-2416(-)